MPQYEFVSSRICCFLIQKMQIRAIATIIIKSANNNDTNDKYMYIYVCIPRMFNVYIYTPLQEFFIGRYI